MKEPKDLKLKDFPESYGSESLENKAKGTVQDSWDELFDDKILLGFIDEAVSKNYNILAAYNRIEAAMADARIAGIGRLPNLDLSFSAARRRDIVESKPYSSSNPYKNDSNRFELSGSISWELDLWGKVRDSSKAAFHQYKATEYEYKAALLSLSANVIRSYINIIQSKKESELLTKIASLKSIDLELAENRYKKGLIPSTLVRTSKLENNIVSSRLLRANQQYRVSIRELEILLNRPPKGSLEIKASDLPEIKAEIPIGIPADILERRPDLLASFNLIKASNYRLSGAKKMFLPSIILTGSAGTVSSDLGNIISLDHIFWSIAGIIKQSLFKGGETKTRVTLQKAKVKEAINLHSYKVLTALKEVENAILDESLSKEEILKTEDLLKEKSAIKDLQLNKRVLGLNLNYNDHINAEIAELESMITLVSLKKYLLLSRVNLVLALGGGLSDVAKYQKIHSESGNESEDTKSVKEIADDSKAVKSDKSEIADDSKAVKPDKSDKKPDLSEQEQKLDKSDDLIKQKPGEESLDNSISPESSSDIEIKGI